MCDDWSGRRAVATLLVVAVLLAAGCSGLIGGGSTTAGGTTAGPDRQADAGFDVPRDRMRAELTRFLATYWSLGRLRFTLGYLGNDSARNGEFGNYSSIVDRRFGNCFRSRLLVEYERSDGTRATTVVHSDGDPPAGAVVANYTTTVYDDRSIPGPEDEAVPDVKPGPVRNRVQFRLVAWPNGDPNAPPCEYVLSDIRDRRATLTSIVESSLEDGSLSRLVRYWNGTDEPTWAGGVADIVGYGTRTPPTAFGDRLNRSLTRNGYVYNVVVEYRRPDGGVESRRIVYRGVPSDEVVMVNATVPLDDDGTLTGPAADDRPLTAYDATRGDDGDYFPIPDAFPEDDRYNVVVVRIYVW